MSFTSDTTPSYSASSRPLGPSCACSASAEEAHLQAFGLRVHRLERLFEARQTDRYRRDLDAGDQSGIVDGDDVGRVHHGQHQSAAAVEAYGEHSPCPAELLGEHAHRRRVVVDLAERRQSPGALPGESGRYLVRGGVAQIGQCDAQSRAGLSLMAEAVLQLTLGDDPLLDQDVTETENAVQLRNVRHVLTFLAIMQRRSDSPHRANSTPRLTRAISADRIGRRRLLLKGGTRTRACAKTRSNWSWTRSPNSP